MATVIFDLDYTILNTVELRKKLASILQITEKQYEKSYEEIFSKKELNYSFEEHFKKLPDAIEDYNNLDMDSLSEFNGRKNELDLLVFKGSKELILAEKEAGNKVVLMTFGNKSWQKEKVDQLKSINNLFNEIEYEDVNKSESKYLKELALDKNIVIINDNTRETVKMIEAIEGERERLGLEKANIKVEIIISKHSETREDLEMAKEHGFEIFENINDIPKSERNESLKETRDIFSREGLLKRG